MTTDAEALVAGPRGRNVSFAVATGRSAGALSDRLGSSIGELAEELDPSAPGVRYARYVPASAIAAPPEPFPLPVPQKSRMSVDQIASALLDVSIDVSVIDPLKVLEDAVDAARYWQEPDGYDALCAVPALRPVLVRAAESLLSRPGTEWWDEPIARTDQWAVDFWFNQTDVPHDIRPDVRTFRAAAIEAENSARLHTPSEPNASYGGTWWSTPLVFTHSFTTTCAIGAAGPVGLHLVEDTMGWGVAQVYPVGVAPSARVYEISTADDWAELCRRYPLRVTASRRHDWYRATGRVGEWVIPDWTSVGEHYDGVHLSVAAYLRAAGVPIPVDEDSASLIAGWDPDQTWWFRSDILDIRDAERTTWQKVNGETWQPQ